MVGITDHGPAMPGGPHIYHFSNLIALPREISGVRILRGAECNVIDMDGSLDLPEKILTTLDIVGAGFHPGCGYEGKSVEENTIAILRVIEKGIADVLVHPGNPLFPVDYEKVVRAAHRKGVLIEINNASFTFVRKGSEKNCRKILSEIKKVGARIVVGSDAHEAELVGVFDEALRLIDEAEIDEEFVVNRNADSVLKFLRGRGKDIST